MPQQTVLEKLQWVIYTLLLQVHLKKSARGLFTVHTFVTLKGL